MNEVTFGSPILQPRVPWPGFLEKTHEWKEEGSIQSTVLHLYFMSEWLADDELMDRPMDMYQEDKEKYQSSQFFLQCCFSELKAVLSFLL